MNIVKANSFLLFFVVDCLDFFKEIKKSNKCFFFHVLIKNQNNKKELFSLCFFNIFF